MSPRDPTTRFEERSVKQQAMFCTHCSRTVNNAELSYFHPVDNRCLTRQAVGRPRFASHTVSKR